MERPAAFGRTLRQPRFVGFHMAPADGGHAGDRGVVARQELSKLTEHKIRSAHSSRPQTQCELGKVPLHGRREPWCDCSPHGSTLGCLVGGAAAWQLVGHRRVEQGRLSPNKAVPRLLRCPRPSRWPRSVSTSRAWSKCAWFRSSGGIPCTAQTKAKAAHWRWRDLGSNPIAAAVSWKVAKKRGCCRAMSAPNRGRRATRYSADGRSRRVAMSQAAKRSILGLRASWSSRGRAVHAAPSP